MNNIIRVSGSLGEELRVVEDLRNAMDICRLWVLARLEKEAAETSILVVLQVEFDVSAQSQGSVWSKADLYDELHLNFLFFARQSLAILSTFALQSAIALSNSFVTSSPGCSCTKETVPGAVVVVSIVVTVVVDMCGDEE